MGSFYKNEDVKREYKDPPKVSDLTAAIYAILHQKRQFLG